MAPVCFASDARGPENFDARGYGVVAADVPAALLRRCADEGMAPGMSVTRMDGTYTGTRRQ